MRGVLVFSISFVQKTSLPAFVLFYLLHIHTMNMSIFMFSEFLLG